MKKLVLIFLLLPTTVLFANEYHGDHKKKLANISNVVEQGKHELYLIHDAYMNRKNMSPEWFTEQARKARNTFKRAENLLKNLKDSYYASLGCLKIAEGYASFYPELPLRIGVDANNKGILWFPYKDAMKMLDDALFYSNWIKKTNFRNKFGFIADISFFVHLQYDFLRERVAPIEPDAGSSAHTLEKPSRICFNRGLQAINKAINAEVYSEDSQHRRKEGIKRRTYKFILFTMVKERFEINGIESSEPALIDTQADRGDSLPRMSRRAYEASKVNFTETKAFKFFDFLGDIFL